jgi:hypothetical protein
MITDKFFGLIDFGPVIACFGNIFDGQLNQKLEKGRKKRRER